jgi:hypothetical protein
MMAATSVEARSTACGEPAESAADTLGKRRYRTRKRTPQLEPFSVDILR